MPDFNLSHQNLNATALQWGEHQMSFGTLLNQVTTMAHRFKTLPCGILTLTAHHHPHFIIQLLAALISKQPVAILSTQWSDEESHERKTILGTNFTIDEAGHIEQLNQSTPPPLHPDCALILFTSGSSGQPKAVQLSMINIHANCHAVINSLRFKEARTQLLFLPLSYSFGLLGQLLPGLMTGLTTVLLPHFIDIKPFFEQTATSFMLSGVPSHWMALTKMASFAPQGALNVSHVISAGAPLSKELRLSLKQSFPNARLFNNYGLTEASPRVLCFSSDDEYFFSDYVGYPVGDWQVKLKEGETFFIKGSQVMLGYVHETHPSRIHDGWLSTGDIAEITPSGLIKINGRLDNVIKIAGNKVNVLILEQQLTSLPSLTDVAVVTVPDTLYGHRLVIFFQKKDTPDTLSDPVYNDIKQVLSDYKLPLLIHPLIVLPRNQNGKIDREALSQNALTLIKEKMIHDTP